VLAPSFKAFHQISLFRWLLLACLRILFHLFGPGLTLTPIRLPRTETETLGKSHHFQTNWITLFPGSVCHLEWSLLCQFKCCSSSSLSIHLLPLGFVYQCCLRRSPHSKCGHLGRYLLASVKRHWRLRAKEHVSLVWFWI
jgi:hypothetical protein